MEHFGLQRFHLFYRKRVGFGQYTLCTLVGIKAIMVLKKYTIPTRIAEHIDIHLAQTVDFFLRFLPYFCNQLKGKVGRKMVHTMRHIERSSTCHVDGLLWSDDPISGDMPDTTYFIHRYCLPFRSSIALQMQHHSCKNICILR